MSKFLLTLVAAAIASSSIGAINVAKNKAQNETNNQYEVVNLKEKVMRRYYDELDDFKKNEIEYEDFEDGYYSSGMSIKDYTETVKESTNIASSSSGSRGSGGKVDDVRHIISNYRKMNGTGSRPSLSSVIPQFDKEELSINWDQNHEMCFSLEEGRNPDIPVYYEREELETEEEKANYIPWENADLRVGDIVWDTISSVEQDPINIVTHMALISNTCKRGYTEDNYGNRKYFNFVETIEAFSSGVRFGFLDDDRILECGTVVLRVGLYMQNVRDSAVNFMLHQYGEPYDLDLTNNYPVPDSSRNKWFCTQLVFAAYYNAGLDITEVISDSFDPVVDDNGIIRTQIVADHIARGRWTYSVGFYDAYLEQFVSVSKYSNQFELTNLSGKPYNVSYAGSLYFWNDALKNYKTICKKNVSVPDNSTVAVNISNNLLANTAALYAKDGTAMYTTLAHHFADCWFNSYIQTTVDDFEITHNESNYSIKIRNRGTSTETYYYPSALMTYNDATNWNFSNGITKKSIQIAAGNTATVTVNKKGNNMFAPFVLKNSTEDNNAALVRITPNKNNYHMVSPTYIDTTPSNPGGGQGGGGQGGNTQTYPTITAEGQLYFSIDSSRIREFGHGQPDLYILDMYVPYASIPVSSYETVEVTYYEDLSDGAFFNGQITACSEGFSVYLFTNNLYAEGGINVHFTYQAELILESISLSGDYQTDFFVGQPANTDNIVVTAHYTCGYSRVIDSSDSNLGIYVLYYDSTRPCIALVAVMYTENGISFTEYYNIVVRYPNITSMSFEGDFQTDFYVGDEFNYDGLEVYATLETGEVVEADSFYVDSSAVDMTTEGFYEVYVTAYVNGIAYTDYYFVSVENLVLESISLSGNQATVFEVGDTFNYDGLVVTAHYANGDTRVVTDYTVVTRTIDMNTAGTYNVKVRYTENDITVNATYQITVVYNGPTLTGITLSGDYQTSFQVGEQFNHDGLVVTAHYSDGTSRVVTNYAVMPMNYNPNRPGTYNVIINYSDNGGFAITSYSVTVEFLFTPVFLESITLSGNYRTNFRMGQALDFTGLIVTANYTDGSSEEVTNYTIDTSDVDVFFPGTYQVRVLYTFKGVTAVAIITIRISRFIKDTDLPTLPDDPIKPFPGKF